MLEPIIGLVVCVALYLGVWLGSKLSTEFARDHAFERWCASKPIILAVRCRGDAYDARFTLRTLLAPHDQLVNLHGGAPWQYYRFDVDVRPLSDSVVAVQIVDAVQQRGGFLMRRNAAELVERLLATPRAAVEEIWMHGQLHPSDAPSSHRDQRSWLGKVAEGALEVTPMIGRPQWLEADANV